MAASSCLRRTGATMMPDLNPRLFACHGHMMIGNQQEAHGHRLAHGCEVEELDQETSDAIRELWRKEQYDRVGALIVHAGRVGSDA